MSSSSCSTCGCPNNDPVFHKQSTPLTEGEINAALEKQGWVIRNRALVGVQFVDFAREIERRVVEKIKASEVKA